jgi:hypothetical protein
MAAPLDVLSDPNFAEYLKRAMTAQPAPGFEEALAEDAQARDRAGLQTGLSQAAALLRNQNVPTLQPHPQGDGMKAWLARQTATNQAQDNALKPLEIAARFRALKGPEAKPPTPDAILEGIGARGGYSGAELDALRDRPDDAMAIFKQRDSAPKAPPTPEQIARGKALRLIPAEGETSEDYEKAIRAEERAAEARGWREQDEKTKRDEKARTEKDATFISEDFTPTVKPLPPPVQADLQKRASANAVVLDNAKQVESILKDGGPAVVGERAAELSMLINNIWVELKDIKNLGVLAGPDMGILQAIVADPSSLNNVLKDATAVRALLPQIQKFQARMKDDMVKRVSGYGARPVGGGAYLPAQQAAGGAPADPLGIR